MTPASSVHTNQLENGDIEKKDTTKQESHKRQFRGTFAPTVLHDLVETGKINTTAAWLCMVIESLSKTDRGCYASNKFLGEKIHRNERVIRTILSSLEQIGLLISEWKGNERRLWIDWNLKSNSKRSNVYYNKEDRLKTAGLTGRNQPVRPAENSRKVNIDSNNSENICDDVLHRRIYEEKNCKNGERIFDADLRHLYDLLSRGYCKSMNVNRSIFKDYFKAKRNLKNVVENYGLDRVTKDLEYYSNNVIISQNTGEILTIKNSNKIENCLSWIENDMRRRENYRNSNNSSSNGQISTIPSLLKDRFNIIALNTLTNNEENYKVHKHTLEEWKKDFPHLKVIKKTLIKEKED